MQTDMLPVARPLLPRCAALIPYLERIDASRVYSNFGPLCQALETRLAAMAQVEPARCVTGANATAVLTATLMSIARPGRDVCILPSWTFCASAHAVVAAGLTPYFIDVDEATWQITPALVEASGIPQERVAAVMTVAPFGVPVDLAPWDGFVERTGVPVLVDAAAAMGNQGFGQLPVVVSLHPTKSLGAGEGAFLIAPTSDQARQVRARLNFGFLGERVANYASLNGKMSEYACATALAALDEWEATRAQWRSRLAHYRTAVARQNKVSIFNDRVDLPTFVTSTLVVTTPDRELLRDLLRVHGIDTRLWWNAGCHREPAFLEFGRSDLPVTDRLARTSLGLPLFRDMTDRDIDRIADVIVQHAASTTT